MHEEKKACKVNLFCVDGSFVNGYVHIAQGLRLFDFLNSTNEEFIVVTEARFQNLSEIRSFKLVTDLHKKKRTVFLNKNAVKWVEEVNDEK
jgi:hypothetical protein